RLARSERTNAPRSVLGLRPYRRTVSNARDATFFQRGNIRDSRDRKEEKPWLNAQSKKTASKPADRNAIRMSIVRSMGTDWMSGRNMGTKKKGRIHIAKTL